MSSIRCFVFMLAALVVCQSALAQSATPAATATQAMILGHALPVVPVSSVAAGSTRPHIDVRGTLAYSAPGPAALPVFCNKFISGLGYIFCPNALRTTYSVDKIVGANGGAGAVIGIVDAFHYAGANADLSQFSTDMGLPQCTIASGCFTQVNQVGGAPRAGGNSGWELETMLDLEYAHAIAPNAKLVLVEADTNSFTNLDIAVATALAAPFSVDVLSNSYGTTTFVGEETIEGVYAVNKPILFSSGDNGTPTSFPCTSRFVTCVGGTTLHVDASFNRISETGWSGSGGGCAASEPGQTYQTSHGIAVCGGTRATPDIAAIADPATGVAVLDSGNGGYFLVGGTSLATPVMAGMIANINTARISFGKGKLGFLNNALYGAFGGNYPYFYFDVTSGNNGLPAGIGFDLVTGMGVIKAPAMGNRFFGLP